MKTFKIDDIPDFSKKDRIVVVGVIGKSPYRYPNKTTPLLPTVDSEENGIECHWDERRGVLYLHAVTYLDTKQLCNLAADLNENSKSTEKDADASHWLVASGELAIDSCRTMALLFHLCHIVVLSHPTPVFDMGYLQLFKAIDAYRTELSNRTAAALSPLGGVWASHGRGCCPRLVFHCRRAPAPLRARPAALKRLEHAVEDQLYYILRKARIITNVCAKSLFAIPKNEEFVYINTEEGGGARDVSSLVRELARRCGVKTAGPAPGHLTGAGPAAEAARPTFAQFLRTHIDMAFAEGFDDNVGKYAMTTSFFELPSASSWRQAAQALAPIYLSSEEQDSPGPLFDALATDVRFSQARCAKVLPIAQASYAEGLPSHYSSQHHAHKESVALGVLESMARGPLAGGARARLRAACRATHKARSLCEAPSLTGHPCILPEHDSSKEHSSGVRYVQACNCGRTRAARDDAYSVRRANSADCGACPSAPAPLPVFTPSTPAYRAASVKGGNSQETEEKRRSPEPEAEGEVDPEGEGEAAAWSLGDALSPGSAHDDATPASDGYVVPVRDTGSEKAISRQPSTTEYLPGMLHTGSPAGLLPAYPSWALVCLGPSSLYSHAAGLPEHLQPGFLPHTNYLLPWDCAVRLEQSTAPTSILLGAGRARGRGRPAGAHHLTVKIFIGFEYECPRGHRFMMWSPDSVAAGGSGAANSAGAREAGAMGARLAASDMPLRSTCPCRAGARLARLHVVTPKAQVHVTLRPQAQPVPGGPIFVPVPAGSPPLKLSPSSYWVLRLPRVYADERGPIRARVGSPGALLAPIFGLQD